MKDRSTQDRQRKDQKNRQGSPTRPNEKGGWKGEPSDDAARRRGPGHPEGEPHKRMPPDELE